MVEKQRRQILSKPSQPFSAILFMAVVCLAMVFSAQNVSAFEWDNIHDYDEETKEVTFTNALGLGDTIGKAKLLSPLNKMVPIGYQEVARYNLWAYQDYNDALKQMEFLDMRNGKSKINRDYDLKMLTFEDIEVNDYYVSCEDVWVPVNNSYSEVCESIQNGTHTEQVEVWTRVTPADLKKNDMVTIGIFTDVQRNDFVDWIPMIYGVEVPEWATWTASMNVGLEAYYKMEESSGDLIDATPNGMDCDPSAGSPNQTAGKIDFGQEFDKATTYFNCTDAVMDEDVFSVNFWINFDSFSNNWGIFAKNKASASQQGVRVLQIGAGGLRAQFQNGATECDVDLTGYSTGEGYAMYTLVRYTNGTTLAYRDGTKGVSVDCGAYATTNYGFIIGANGAAALPLDGQLDEFGVWNRTLTQAEITDLYNSDAGLQYVDAPAANAPSVTLTSPADFTNFTVGGIDFVTVATDDIKIDNVSLYINGTLNETNSSGINGTYTFSKVFVNGPYNWSILAWNNNSLSNQSATREFNVSIPGATAPSVTLTSPTDFTNFTTPNIDFVTVATDAIKIDNVSLYINGTLNETNSSGVNGTYTFSKVFVDGHYNWSILAWNNNSLSNQSATREFNVSIPGVVIIQNNPTDTSTSQVPLVNVSCSASAGDGVLQLNLTIDGTLNKTVTNSTPGENLTNTLNTNFTEGNYTWGCSAYNSMSSTVSSNRTFEVLYSSPVVNLLSPGNDSSLTSQAVSFSFNVTDLNGVSNASLYIDDVLNETNTTGVSGDYSFDKTIVDGNHNWSVIANSIFGKTTTSSTYIFSVDTSSPVITLSAPPLVFGKLVDADPLNLNWTVTDLNLASCWYYYSGDYDNVALSNSSFTSGYWKFITGGTVGTGNNDTLASLIGFPGFYLGVQGAANNLEISQFTSTAQNCLSATYFAQVDISAASDGYWSCVRNQDTGDVYTIEQTAFNTGGSTSKFTSYDGQTDVNCSVNTTSFNYSQDHNSVTFFANDTSDNKANSTRTWTVQFTEGAQTYPTTSTESKTETYTAAISYNSSQFLVATASLELNGTTYLGTKVGTGDSISFTADAIMPVVDTPTNFTSTWTVSLTDVNGTTDTDLTEHNVTVDIINMSICGSPHTTPFWNFTVYNETNNASLFVNFDATFGVRLSGSSSVNTFSFSELNSSFDFCFYPAFEDYTVATNIKLSNNSFVTRFYDWQNKELTNTTTETSLYMLSEDSSTSYIIEVVDGGGTPIESAEVNVERFYPGINTWVTVEIVTTNTAGQSVGNLVDEEANYRFKVYKNAISIYNSTATQITCQELPCTVTLVVPIEVATGLETIENLTSSLTYSKTSSIFTYTYTDTSSNLDNARFQVIKLVPGNATIVTICNETKTATSGVMICDISGQLNGTYSASGYITRDSTEALDRKLTASKGTELYTGLGDDGVFWSFMIIISALMLGLARPSIAIIFSTVGLFFVAFLGLVNVGAVSLVAVSVIGIILLMRVGRE